MRKVNWAFAFLSSRMTFFYVIEILQFLQLHLQGKLFVFLFCSSTYTNIILFTRNTVYILIFFSPHNLSIPSINIAQSRSLATFLFRLFHQEHLHFRKLSAIPEMIIPRESKFDFVRTCYDVVSWWSRESDRGNRSRWWSRGGNIRQPNNRICLEEVPAALVAGYFGRGGLSHELLCRRFDWSTRRFIDSELRASIVTWNKPRFPSHLAWSSADWNFYNEARIRIHGESTLIFCSHRHAQVNWVYSIDLWSKLLHGLVDDESEGQR